MSLAHRLNPNVNPVVIPFFPLVMFRIFFVPLLGGPVPPPYGRDPYHTLRGGAVPSEGWISNPRSGMIRTTK